MFLGVPKIQCFPNFKFFPIRSEIVIKFQIFPKFKKSPNHPRGGGGGSRKLWTFSTFWDIFFLIAPLIGLPHDLNHLLHFFSLPKYNFVLATSLKGVVSSYQIGLVLPSVAEIHQKIYPSQSNLKFSICRHIRGKVLSHENNHSMLWNIIFDSVCRT